MNNKVLLSIVFILISLSAFIVFAVHGSLTRGGIDIQSPLNATRIFNFEQTSLNLTLLGNNVTHNITWFAQNNNSNYTIAILHSNTISNTTANWTAVPLWGYYNITVIATNNSDWSSNGSSNLTTGGFQVANPNWTNASTGYNILFIKNLADSAITLNTPVPGQNITGNYTFNASITDTNMTTNVTWVLSLMNNGTNRTLSLNNALNNLNVTNNTAFIADGMYHIYIRATNSSLYSNNVTKVSSNVTIDNTLPLVKLDSPANYSNDTDGTITFNFTVIETNIANCSLFGDFNGTFSLNQTNGTEITNGTTFAFRPLTLANNVSGGYTWNVRCTDYVNNIVFNNTNFTVFVSIPGTPSPGGESSSGAGSSGGGGPDLGNIPTGGLTAVVHEDRSINFAIGGISHTLRITQVKSSNIVEITIFSHPIGFEIAKGETKNIDLNHDTKGDISVTILEIDSSKNVKLTIKLVKTKSPIVEFIKDALGIEEKPKPQLETNVLGEDQYVEPVETEKKYTGTIFGIIILILLLGIIYFYFKKEKKKVI